jgi:PAS domain S-box-containing protein
MKKFMTLSRAMQAPIVAVVIVGLAILSVELLIMLSLDEISARLGGALSVDALLIVDPLVLVVLISPLLYWLFMRPMLAQQAELVRKHNQLEKLNASLEQKVLERTSDLLEAQVELQRDIAERKRIEAALLRNKEMLNEAQQLVHLGSWDRDLVANHMVWSDEIFRIFEVDLACQDVRYETCLSFAHPDDRELVNQAYITSVKEKSAYDITYRLLLPDGRVKWVHERCNTFYDADGKPLRSIGTTQDITERKLAENLLRESEEKLRGLYELSPLGIALTDMQGRFIEYNKAFLDICGYPEDELDALDYWTLTPKKYEADEARQLESLQKTGRYGPYVKEYIRKDGSLISVQLNGLLITGRDGKKYIWSIFEDITERKRIEAVSRRHKEMLDEAQQLVHLGSWDMDLVANHMVWSDEIFRIFEVDLACRDVSYETCLSFAHPDDRELVNQAYITSVKEKSAYDITYRLLLPDGRVKWVHERCNTFYDADGKPLRSIGTTQDITRYKEAQDARTRFATILQESPDVVGIVDSAGRTLFFNKAGRKLLGMGETEDISHLKIADYHPDWAARVVLEEGLPAVVAQGTWSGETALLTRSGKEIPMLQVIMSHKDEDGAVEFYAAVMHNISARKTMEAELHTYNDELEDINRQLRDAQANLLQSEKMASIGQLAAGVAHEINNPIGFVSSNFGALEQYLKDLFEMLDVYERVEATMPEAGLIEVRKVRQQKELAFLREDVPALMNESRDGITRVKKIIQNLKEFSHAGDSDEWQWADLHSGLDSTLAIVWNEIKYHAQVNKEYGDIPEIECLPSELNQVFMNLLVNAAHAIETTGVITIRTGMQGEEVFVQISDNGHGILPENLKRIFDPFFTTKPVGKGTGLGLSLSFGIVKKHHGRIEVQSEAGRGTAFTLWLPVKHS